MDQCVLPKNVARALSHSSKRRPGSLDKERFVSRRGTSGGPAAFPKLGAPPGWLLPLSALYRWPYGLRLVPRDVAAPQQTTWPPWHARTRLNWRRSTSWRDWRPQLRFLLQQHVGYVRSPWHGP